MKICSDCDTLLPLEAFNLNRAKPDGRGSKCRECMKVYRKGYYELNKKACIAKVRVRSKEERAMNRVKLKDFLCKSKCVDCGNDNPIVLEFDHRDPKNKEYAIAQIVGSGYCWETIAKEIDKCDVVCANCHRIRTSNQFNTHRSLW